MNFSWINGSLSVLIVSFCLLKQYSIYSIIEHVLFLLHVCFGHHKSASFCFCISVKVVVSLGFFIWETLGMKELNILRYLIGSWNQPCHALVSAGEKVFHYHQPRGEGNSDHPLGVSDRLFDLKPALHPKPLTTLLPKMFHSPCVGFAIPNFDSTNINQRLEVCGKCHDWAVSVVYVLSCHKFLSYSVVSYVRWISWVGFAIFSAFWFGDATNDYMKGIFLSDAILQVITLMDIINMVKFRLEDDKASEHFKRRSYLNILKLIVLCTVIWLLKSSIPSQVQYYGYYLYLITCAICGFIIHFWSKWTKK